MILQNHATCDIMSAFFVIQSFGGKKFTSKSTNIDNHINSGKIRRPRRHLFQHHFLLKIISLVFNLLSVGLLAFSVDVYGEWTPYLKYI